MSGLQHDIVFFDEDRYLEVEFLPIASREFCMEEMKKISGFAQEHFDGYGFTAVYRRDGIPPAPLAEAGIPAEALTALAAPSLQQFHKMYYHPVGAVSELSNTLAFGYQYFTLFAEHDPEGLIKHIWVSGYSADEIALNHMTAVLSAIGKKWKLILADWEACVIVDAESPVQLTEHFRIQ